VCGASVGVLYRTDTLVDVVQLSALLAVYRNAAAHIAGSNGFPQLAVKRWCLLAGVQNALGLACNLLPGVAGQSFERGIYIFDDAFTIGDEDGIGRLLNRTGKLAQGFFRKLPLLLRGVQVQRAADRAQQVRSVEL